MEPDPWRGLRARPGSRVTMCVCVCEVQEEMKGCSRPGCGKGATVRQRFRALSWLTTIMHHMAHHSLGPSPLL